MDKFLVSSGLFVTLLFFAFGIGYYAKKHDWPIPPILEDYIPEGKKRVDSNQKTYRWQGARKVLKGIPQVNKYVLPLGATDDEFLNCLSSRAYPLYEGRDYRLKRQSTLIRFLVPIGSEGVLSSGYEYCRSQFSSTK